MLTIAGFALDEEKWDGIYVGRRNGDDLVYAGKVDHGFDKGLGRGLIGTVEAVDPQDAALCQADRPQGHLGRTETPGRDRAKSAAGKIRHPFFKGLREDL
jgi:bifunctional non-homologous end joining protein LigD